MPVADCSIATAFVYLAFGVTQSARNTPFRCILRLTVLDSNYGCTQWNGACRKAYYSLNADLACSRNPHRRHLTDGLSWVGGLSITP